jgi:hypothetical protein
MRTVHWLFVVSVALFVTGIGFVIAAGRTAQTAGPVEAGAEAPVMTPVASIRQICAAIVGPNATVVYGAVGYVVTAAGVEETVPQNDEEWAVVANSAAALVEAGNLFLLGDRAVDRGDWVTMTQAFIDQGKLALAAAEAQSTDGILDSGSNLNTTCDNCHERYQRQ